MDSNLVSGRLRTALLVGGSGAIGSALIQALSVSGRYGRIHCVGRRLLELDHEQIVEHVVDFECLADWSLEAPVDDVFCAIGTTLQVAGSAEAFRRVDYDLVLAVGTLAKRLNAQTLSVVSSLGADASAKSLYLRTKGEMEMALIALELPVLHIFRPSLLAGSVQRSDFRLKEVLANGLLAVLGPLFLHGRLRKYRRVAPTAVAHSMVCAGLESKRGLSLYENDAIFDLCASGL
ncbi:MULTISPECIES: oxidoreductase [unclassified Lentimonas]|uniref:oxidoreductase n=1 Tax=unclassified Lentimonas TaxID=2630993 RepID=UPI00132B10E4|nr:MULTISPECIES: oxidoreductase [unclassified Lentimonas]CAA6679104.1 Unannotated [Lentimonas sp. CC4]CAA6684154.1 Unannotated [Lentimonas sp. CC6]CAA7076472.1 Unannotated [Lentimonas sp. CC4]CAA7170408.1 Unannotated [Lentimonas sp. CC21]CAA7182819.1 Unannotated [Lentimonas sp. CC8]